MRVKTYAKINLSLDVLSRREDGYSNIDTIMQPIDLWDEMEFIPGGDRFILETDDPTLPTDGKNLITKAYELLKDRCPGSPGMRIRLTKNIPVAAGLAGGTGNGAATLKVLNELWGLGLTNQELAEKGLTLGADFPYFFHETTLRARGVGEVITPLSPLPPTPILIINSGEEMSTALVYRKTVPNPQGEERMESLLALYEKGERERFFKNLYNRMEDAVIPIVPAVARAKKALLAQGALGALMSGSGPTVFGIFSDEAARDRAYANLRSSFARVVATWTK